MANADRWSLAVTVGGAWSLVFVALVTGFALSAMTRAVAAAPVTRMPAARVPVVPAPATPEPARVEPVAPAALPAAEVVPDSRNADLRMLPSGGSAIHFEVKVPPLELIAIESDGAPGGALRANLEGYEPFAPRRGPALPERIVVVAVPPAGDVRVRAQGAGGAVREDVTLEGSALAQAPRAGVATASSPAEVADAEPARLIEVGWLRNQRVARVAIHPVTYDAARRRVTTYSQVDVVLEVAPVGDLGLGEPNDAFEGVYRDLLINYEQGRRWRRPAAAGARSMAPGSRADLRRFAVTASPETSVYAGRLWVKLKVTQPGFYKVSFGQLRNTALFTQTGSAQDTMNALDSLRLFTWPGTPVLPEKSFCDSCDYREVGIQIVDVDNDYRFVNNTDYFYFFALGASDWLDAYDPSRTDSTYLDHPYETRNFYYLTLATAAQPVGGTPVRILSVGGAVTANPATTPTTFDARARIERDVEYFPDATPLRGHQKLFWEKWMWRGLSLGQSYADTFSLSGCDFSQPLRFRLRAWGLSHCDSAFCTVCLPGHLLDVSLNGNAALAHMGWYDDTGVTFDSVLAAPGSQLISGINTLVVGVPQPSSLLREDRSALAWIELYYQHLLTATNDRLTFDSPAAADNFRFGVDGFTSATAPRVFDVTDPLAPFQITSFGYDSIGASSWRLTFERPQSGRRHYRILPDAGIVSFPSASISDAPATSLQNLRSPTLGADFIVVYFDAFAAAAESLAAWRQTHLPLSGGGTGPSRTMIVPVSALYDQYSGGRTDPAAIRNFLRSAWDHWRIPQLAYVTLLGDASFDFKNITGHAQPNFPSCLLPAYENGFDPSVFLDECSPIGRQFASDDWIFNLDSAQAIIPDVQGARIPVDDELSAMEYVRNKILFFERNAPLGEYRNRVMLVADDDKQGKEDILHWLHVQQTRDLDTLSTPSHIDRRYVYLHKYPTGPGSTKPGAKADIKKNLAEGVAIWNYVGHGSPFKIADEGVFLDVDTGTLTNATMLPLFVSASCDVGKFNDPAVQSLGERLITQPGGGAIGVISATELAFANQNATLNQTLYDESFRRDPLSGRYFQTVGEALLVAKQQATETTQKYELLGDAALRLNLPRESVELTLWDSAGAVPLTDLQTGQTVMFRGSVRDRPGGTTLPYDGVASLEIDDSAPFELTPPCPDGCERVFYVYTPGVMFRGNTGVSAGSFQGRFVVPLEAAIGVRGRVRAYVTGRSGVTSYDEDGVGAIRTHFSTGTPPPGDQQGPRITLSFLGGSATVKPNAELRVDLFDASGILTTGHNPQNGIVVTLDENTTTRVDITPSFRYAANSYQSGTASFTLPNLAQGAHKIEVSAADNLASGLAAGAHRSKAVIEFEVQESPQLHIARAYLFPDPTSSGGPASGGTFVIDAPGDSLNVLLRMYTVAGRLVRTLRSYGGIGQVQIPWDGLDEEDERLANGVYLFKVHVYGRESDGASSPTERAVSEGRFVIVNR
ncbi:MAG: hypothetical protein HYR73_03130 [Candidatus Eisenbacteria bacterium]|nr:hypothetical protein [Candidatus Eisenbacteria bacterium]